MQQFNMHVILSNLHLDKFCMCLNILFVMCFYYSPIDCNILQTTIEFLKENWNHYEFLKFLDWENSYQLRKVKFKKSQNFSQGVKFTWKNQSKNPWQNIKIIFKNSIW